MKLRELIDSKEALKNLAKEPMPLSMAMELKTFIMDAEKHIVSYEDSRNQKIQEYGEDLGDGKYQIKEEEKIKEFIAEMDDALDKDIDIKVPNINSESLQKATISTIDLITLNWLIK